MAPRDPSASGATAWRTGRLTRPDPPQVGERFDPVLALGSIDIEEITSSATPDPTTYDQAQDEWVLVLEGSATLDVDGTTVTLGPDEWLLLPARTKHRVQSADPGTRWLALHLHPDVRSG